MQLNKMFSYLFLCFSLSASFHAMASLPDKIDDALQPVDAASGKAPTNIVEEKKFLFFDLQSLKARANAANLTEEKSLSCIRDFAAAQIQWYQQTLIGLNHPDHTDQFISNILFGPDRFVKNSGNSIDQSFYENIEKFLPEYRKNLALIFSFNLVSWQNIEKLANESKCNWKELTNNVFNLMNNYQHLAILSKKSILISLGLPITCDKIMSFSSNEVAGIEKNKIVHAMSSDISFIANSFALRFYNMEIESLQDIPLTCCWKNIPKNFVQDIENFPLLFNMMGDFNKINVSECQEDHQPLIIFCGIQLKLSFQTNVKPITGEMFLLDQFTTEVARSPYIAPEQIEGLKARKKLPQQAKSCKGRLSLSLDENNMIKIPPCNVRDRDASAYVSAVRSQLLSTHQLQILFPSGYCPTFYNINQPTAFKVGQMFPHALAEMKQENMQKIALQQALLNEQPNNEQPEPAKKKKRTKKKKLTKTAPQADLPQQQSEQSKPPLNEQSQDVLVPQEPKEALPTGTSSDAATAKPQKAVPTKTPEQPPKDVLPLAPSSGAAKAKPQKVVPTKTKDEPPVLPQPQKSAGKRSTAEVDKDGVAPVLNGEFLELFSQRFNKVQKLFCRIPMSHLLTDEDKDLLRDLYFDPTSLHSYKWQGFVNMITHLGGNVKIIQGTAVCTFPHLLSHNRFNVHPPHGAHLYNVGFSNYAGPGLARVYGIEKQ